MENSIVLKFYSKSENEQLARSCISALLLPLNPTLSEMGDVKTAVSEAVTNAIVHGYPDSQGLVTLEASIKENLLHIKVKDEGVGIPDVKKALEPFYTTKSEKERSGIGFTIMQTFMDEFEIKSEINKGTTVSLTKKISLGK